ncbi:SulP family inorganic anion transporter [Pseudomaricurvus alkylphenolicus]|uniref:SulP family inorganic anion transporter n=1 Tax=Pseudomaricurvus alkylphenolicus TaxID=1306991 RepID=UPI00197E914D|nr:sulfate permease [Pseudomaricurvus alkylphenolicus]
MPILTWGRQYNRQWLARDLLAAVIVTVMLIPQSLAYALLAGLPPETGLYASILPLLAYACFGTSRTLAVGPVAVVSLMTASAAGAVASQGSIGYLTAVVALALLSGVFLLLMGILRLGMLANFLSHPVVSGFVSASALIIILSQLSHLLGIRATGHTLTEMTAALLASRSDIHLPTLLLGSASLLLLWWMRRGLKARLLRLGLSPDSAALAAKSGPLLVITMAIVLSYGFDWQALGIAVVGSIPSGLPLLALPGFEPALWRDLAASALLISIIGFVESIAMARTLAAKRRQRVDADQELIGLGAANLASSVSGGFPVTGGFSRSVVNNEAGAETPAAGAFTAVGIGLATLYLTSLLSYLPVATLAATIVVAVASLIDLKVLRQSWRYSRSDLYAALVTMALTLLMGVEVGVLTGLGLSLMLFLHRTSRPHMAVVGQVEGTEHFRNCRRHKVILDEKVISLRVDESLYFANAGFLQDRINSLLATSASITDLVLMCSAVNDIDLSALETLEEINHQLQEAGVRFHLSELKGPVMDKLQRSCFLDKLSGRVFLTQYEAFTTLAQGIAAHPLPVLSK